MNRTFIISQFLDLTEFYKFIASLILMKPA